MTWFSTFVVAFITGAVGLILSGYVANMAVSWHRMSSFEGASGYFVVFTAIGGMIAGFLIGIVASRVVSATANPGFFKGLGFSLLCIVSLVGAVGGVSRMRADVPPLIGGEGLMLVVEARWPATRTESPANTPGIAYLRFGTSTSNHVERASSRGALWKEDAHRVDGRWTVTGAAPVFTTRGSPTISIALNDQETSGHLVPMPSRPTQKQFTWSEWYPRDGKTGPPKSDAVNYRFRVQKMSIPLRTETVGPFDIDAVIRGFTTDAAIGTTTLDAYAQFAVKYRGQPVRFAGNASKPADKQHYVSRLALLPGSEPALIAYVEAEGTNSYCALLTDAGGSVREMHVSNCSNSIQATELTSDNARFHDTRSPAIALGRIDRLTFKESKYLEFPQSVLDVNARAIHKTTATSPSGHIPSVHPLGVSPDGRSFVRFANGSQGEGNPQMVVTDFVGDRVYDVPVDPMRMRYGKLGDLDPNWLMHHFQWERKGSVDILTERTGFVPIAYHGYFNADSGGTKSYQIDKATQDIRLVLVELIKSEFNGIRGALHEGESDATAYQYPMTVAGHKLKVGFSKEFGYVMVELDHGENSTDLVRKIGERFNTILSTGKHDKEFVATPR